MKLLFMIITLFLFPFALTAEEAPEGYKRVKFSEVCFWPEEGESEWIELYNASGSVIDISGWKLQWSGGGEFVFPERELLLEPMEVVVVEFNGTSSILKLPFVDCFSVGANQSGDVLNNEADFLTLHSSDSERVDLVMWGNIPEYPSMNRFDQFMKFRMDDLLPDFSYGGVKTFASRGGSYFLKKHSWSVLGKQEHTKGYLDFVGYKTPPVPSFPLNNLQFDNLNEDIYLEVYGQRNVSSYQFLLSLDENFTDTVFLSKYLGSPRIRINDYLPPEFKVLFWKARTINNDGMKSNWCDPRKISGKPNVRTKEDLAPIGFGGFDKVEINLSEFKKDRYYLKVLSSNIPNMKYKFQVARDTSFSDVIFTSSASASFVCPVERKYLPGIKKSIFWRARYVWPEGNNGNWGKVYEIYGGDYEVTEFLIKKPKPKGKKY